MNRKFLFAICVLLFICRTDAPAADDSAWHTFSENHCVSCHNKDEKKGNLDLTSLGSDLSDKALFNRWVKIHDRIKAGEMPPKKKPDPAEVAPASRMGGRQSHSGRASARAAAGRPLGV